MFLYVGNLLYLCTVKLKTEDNMETFELIEQLSKKSKVEIEYALLSLMIDNKIDFVSLNNAYVKYLEMKTDDMKSKLVDANCCTLSLLSNFKGKSSRDSLGFV